MLTAYLLYVGVIAIFLVLAFFVIRARVKGKLLVFFVDKDKTFKSKLFHPDGKLFKFKKDDEAYVIEPDCIMLVRYPFAMPGFLQQVVPCLIYAKDNPQPMNPKEISIVPKGLTAKMVSSVVSETVVARIVKGVDSKDAKSRFPAWFLPVVTLFLVLILALMVWQMNGKVGAVYDYMQRTNPQLIAPTK